MSIHAVMFDMDGVLVDSERHWAPLENEHILPRTTASGEVTASEISGLNVADLYAYLIEEYETTIDKREFVALYDEVAEDLYSERATLVDGFDDLVEMLREREVKISLVTSSPRRWVQLVLDRFGLDGVFDTIVCADDIDGASKPAPDIYEYAADTLTVAPQRCIAIEDSSHGVQAARSAGMYCLGYRTEANHGQDLTNADQVAAGATELHDQLHALFSSDQS
ncbi:HAD family hydrolase [Saliphagus infecundisoli]|uniref:HAD family hydrolase n=1 Tax=Saliphagus infecundisoli TaxID=1849069 RepID=A0ABD5QE94_9EURY|nr:HAD family phosphatase [Saliphagus infecundisoli]